MDTGVGDTQTEGTGTTAEAWTAASPYPQDATEVCSLPENPYVDLAFADNTTASAQRIILARSDGNVEYRRVDSTCSLVRRYTVAWDRLKWIDSSWKLLAASNTAKQIYIGAQCTGTSTCTSTSSAPFPAGVNGVVSIAGYPSGNGYLTIYITYTKQAGNKFIRKGFYASSSPGVINWDSTEYGNTMYRKGLVAARVQNLNNQSPALFEVVDYYTSLFAWHRLDNLSVNIAETIPPGSFQWTEHSYYDPEGCYDRFAPEGMDFDDNNWLFYGLDRYYGAGPQGLCPGGKGTYKWVVATLNSQNLHP